MRALNLRNNVRRFVKISLISVACVLLMFALLVLAALFVFPSNEVELEFATYDAAVAADAIALERVPTFLPRSATKISSVRNLDLNYEVVTFAYGKDFEQFIALQDRIPARTAKSLGIRIRDHRFDNPGQLIYMPKVALYKDTQQGTLLVNHVHKVALYFD